MDKGNYAYVRDGKKYEGGLFGGELEEAVQGNARAEEYAREYKTGMATGFALNLVGAVAMVGGLVLFGIQASQTQSGQTIPPTGLYVAVGGLVVDTAGSIVIASAQPHMTDAINAYNDSLLTQPPSPSNAHGPTATTPPTEPGKVQSTSGPSGAARSP